MKCSKCSGLLIYENSSINDGWRCLNCGKRIFCENKFISYTEFDYFFRKKLHTLAPMLVKIKYKRATAIKEFKKCVNCNSEFQCKTNMQLYCSLKCRKLISNSQRRKKEEIKICVICSVLFIAHYKNKIYCAKKCLKIGNNEMTSKKRNRYTAN